MNAEMHEIINAMETYGGSFVSALAQLYVKADSTNKVIIEQAFENYFEKYAEMVLAMKEREK